MEKTIRSRTIAFSKETAILILAIRLLAFAGNLYFATEGALRASLVFGDVVRSIPGILLQLVVVTALLKMKEKEDNV